MPRDCFEFMQEPEADDAWLADEQRQAMADDEEPAAAIARVLDDEETRETQEGRHG